MLEEKPKEKLFGNGILKFMIKSNLNDCFKDLTCLKGVRMISSWNVSIRNCDVPILAEMKKKIVTNKSDMKINIQDVGSKSLRRFQVGGVLSGYLENQ